MTMHQAGSEITPLPVHGSMKVRLLFAIFLVPVVSRGFESEQAIGSPPKDHLLSATELSDKQPLRYQGDARHQTKHGVPLGYWKLKEGKMEGKELTVTYPEGTLERHGRRQRYTPADTPATIAYFGKDHAVVYGGTQSFLCTTLGKRMPTRWNEVGSFLEYLEENTFCKGYRVRILELTDSVLILELDPEANDLPSWASRRTETYTRISKSEFDELKKKY
jgi:hypothetical protein